MTTILTSLSIIFVAGSCIANTIGSMYLQKQITMLRERLEAQGIWP